MKYIFDVYKDSIKGILEIEAREPEVALRKLESMGFKHSSMREHICIYHIQYAPKREQRWKL